MTTNYQAIDGLIIIILSFIVIYKWFQSDHKSKKIKALEAEIQKLKKIDNIKVVDSNCLTDFKHLKP
jgi:hypothetical protein